MKKSLSTLILLALTLIASAQVDFDYATADGKFCITNSLKVNFEINSSVTINNASWNFGDGATSNDIDSVFHIYTNPGTYEVTLTVNNNQYFIPKTIVINRNPSSSFTVNDQTPCIGDTLLFSATDVDPGGIDDQITLYSWAFGDSKSGQGEAVSHVYNSAFNYTVSLSVTNDKGCERTITEVDYIELKNPPVINQIVGSPSKIGCEEPFDVELSAIINSELPIVFHAWEYGDGSAVDNNPVGIHTYDSYGTYTVNLTVRDDHFCEAKANTSVNLFNVQADFNLPASLFCTGTNYQVLNNSQSANSFQWNFDDGITSNNANPVVNYLNEGTKNITLVAKNASCADTITKSIVAQKVSAGFSIDTSWACTPVDINFTNQSSANATSFLWNFGDGSTSTLENPPAHNYSSAVDSIYLVATTPEGCSNRYSIIDPVSFTRPDADVRVDTSSGCIPKDIEFTDTSIAVSKITQRYWRFGDGNELVNNDAQVVYTYDTSGTFLASLTITDSLCGDETATVIIETGDTSHVDFSMPDTICAASSIEFIDQSYAADDIDAWTWNFGDGFETDDQNPVYSYFNPATRVLDGNNCHSKRLVPDTTMDVSLTTTYNDCPTTGTKPITLVGGLVDIRDLYVDCENNPLELSVNIDAFKADSLAFVFENVDNSVTHEFNVYGGVQRDFIDTTFVFNTLPIGKYYLTLNMVSDSCTHSIEYLKWGRDNCSGGSTDRDTVYINNFIQADYSLSTNYQCVNSPVNFDASSSVNALYYHWLDSVGANNYDDLFGPTSFSSINLAIGQRDTLNIKLVVEGGNGCTDSIVKPPLYIIQPEASFTLEEKQCTGRPVTFSIAVEHEQLPIDTFRLHFDEFNDTIFTSLQDIDYTYNSPGIKYPKLKVSDTLGCSYTFSDHQVPFTFYDSIIIKRAIALPIFNVSGKTSVCEGATIQFYNNTQGMNEYIWNFGDGKMDTLTNNSIGTKNHTFNTPGTFQVSFTTVLDNDLRCEATSYYGQLIHVETKPTILFGADKTFDECWPGFFTFYDSSITETPVKNNYWDLGNIYEAPTNTGDSIASTNYNQPGVFTIKHSVETENCKFIDTLAKEDYIFVGGAYAQFDVVDFTCRYDSVAFVATDTMNNPVNLIWLFDDGTMQSIPDNDFDTIYHTYQIGGTYYPQLNFDDGKGCVSTIPIDNDLLAPRVVQVSSLRARFFQQDSLCGDTVTGIFINNSTDHVPDQSIWATRWEETNSEDFTQEFTSTGDYFLQLKVMDDEGCIDSTIKRITVHPIPELSISPMDTVICPGDTIQLLATENPDYAYTWMQESNLTNHQVHNPGAFPADDMAFSLEVVNTRNSCENTSSNQVKVQDKPNVDFHFVFLNTGDTIVAENNAVTIPIGDSIQLLTSSDQGNAVLTWDESPYILCKVCQPIVAPHENIQLMVSASDSLNCPANKIPNELMIEVIPAKIMVADAFTPNGDGINDMITVTGPGIEKLIEFAVYNRWGELLFTTNNLNEGWDGKYNNKLQNPDTYVYHVKAESVVGTILEKNGAFKLLR